MVIIDRIRGDIDNTIDMAITRARHGECVAHVKWMANGTELTGPFCWPPAVAAGAYCGWLMVSECSLWKKWWSVDCASPTCNCDSRLLPTGTRLVLGSPMAPSAAQYRERELPVCHSINFYTACDLGIDHVQYTVLCSVALDSPQNHRPSLAPLQKVSLILSISASTHLMLSLFTGAAGALAAARDANAASAGICADPYLCCCPGRSFDADDAGRVTDKVNGGCEVCCRGWKCVWWMRSDDGFAT